MGQQANEELPQDRLGVIDMILEQFVQKHPITKGLDPKDQRQVATHLVDNRADRINAPDDELHNSDRMLAFSIPLDGNRARTVTDFDNFVEAKGRGETISYDEPKPSSPAEKNLALQGTNRGLFAPMIAAVKTFLHIDDTAQGVPSQTEQLTR